MELDRGTSGRTASLQVAAFAGADHRRSVDGELAYGYVETVAAFVHRCG
jgi:hypothetical protein